MEITIRNARIEDFDAVTRIMNQVQQLHVGWRPDIYKPNNQLIPKELFEEIVKGDTFFVAETGEKVVGVMEIMYRHIENPAQVTRDVIYIDTMEVVENYRGQGIGHQFFRKVKEIKEEKGFDGIELQVNSKNEAAYEMYKKYGFQVKTYFMELPYSAFSVEKLTEEEAKEICAWRYEGEYSVYNFPDWEECAKLGWSITDGEKRKTEYFAVHTEGQFLGYFHVMNREDTIELGVGIKPELCGKHYGKQLMHLALEKIEEMYPGLPVKLTVRPFNKRAIKCYESVGFKIVEKYYESTYLVPGEMYIMELNRCL